VAIGVQSLSLLLLALVVAGGADYLIVWVVGSLAGVLLVVAIFAVATGLPPPRIGFIASGVAANLIWFFAALADLGLALVGVVSVGSVVLVSRRVHWRRASA
jgi:hypothetical protein